MQRTSPTCPEAITLRLIILYTTVLPDNPGLQTMTSSLQSNSIHACPCNALQQAQNPVPPARYWQHPWVSDEAPLLATKWIAPIVWLRCRSPAVKLLSQLRGCSARHRTGVAAELYCNLCHSLCVHHRGLTSQVSFGMSVSSRTVAIALLGSGCSNKDGTAKDEGTSHENDVPKTGTRHIQTAHALQQGSRISSHANE